MVSSRLALLIPALFLSAASCMGQIAGGDDGETSVERATPGSIRVWRLTTQQYDNTVRDLLGDTSRPARLFTPDIGGTGFTNNADLLGVNPAQAAEFAASAARLAFDAVTSRLGRIFPCPASQLTDAGCARQFIETFGLRAFRRPLGADEVAAYLGLYAQGSQTIDATAGLSLVIETMLQSPHFLYRSEIGDGRPDSGGEVRLTPHELASALSYHFVGSMPDEILFAAASSGSLSTPAGLGAEVERLAARDDARAPMLDFYRQLLDYDDVGSVTRDPKLFPKFDSVLASMQRETQTFIEKNVFEGDARLDTLLTAPHSYIDANLAPIYRLPKPNGTTMVRVDLDPGQRAGLLTQPGFLTIHSLPDETSPPRRGKSVLEKILCLHIPPPIDNIPDPPSPAGKESTRQKFERLTGPPVCMGCHRLLNPAGFSFEAYDVVGAWRTVDNTLPVDTRVDLTGIPGVDGPVAGAVDLVRKIAQSREAGECLARQTVRHAFGRETGSDDDGLVSKMLARFQATGGNVRELFASVAGTRAFTHRRMGFSAGVQ